MINLKTHTSLEDMRKAGEIVGIFFSEVSKLIQPGVQGDTIDKLAYEIITSYGARPSFLNYNGFPASICFSINDEIVHGIPFGKVVPEKALVKIDVGVKYGCCHVDSAYTFIVGELPERTKKLVEVTKKALYRGIMEAKAGRMLSDISKAIERSIKPYGFSIIRDLVGHGVGYELHEEPQVPNYYYRGMKDVELKPNLTLAIEPMVAIGTHKIRTDKDGWTIRTADGSLSAHFEHTIVITENGAEILTKWSDLP